MAEIKGIERIKARILAEANEYAAAKDAESAKKCDALLAERATQSAEKSEQILARAASDAEAARKNAVSGGESRERSEMLKLRVEMADKAFDAALGKACAPAGGQVCAGHGKIACKCRESVVKRRHERRFVHERTRQRGLPTRSLRRQNRLSQKK